MTELTRAEEKARKKREEIVVVTQAVWDTSSVPMFDLEPTLDFNPLQNGGGGSDSEVQAPHTACPRTILLTASAHTAHRLPMQILAPSSCV